MLLEKPERAHSIDLPGMSKPGLPSWAGLNRTQLDRTATIVTPIRPTAAGGAGSRIKPTTTPAKMAAKYQAVVQDQRAQGAARTSERDDDRHQCRMVGPQQQDVPRVD